MKTTSCGEISLVTVKEVAQMLGVSPKTVYEWAEMRFIPNYKLCGCLRFDPDEVREWARRWRREPLSIYNKDGRGPRKGGL